MNDLQVFTHDNVDVVDSRAVAEMVGKNHRDLMRSIHGYIDVMEKSTERNFAPSDFFIPRTYKDSTGRTLPCYLLTKKGCDMVANKMTGEKGVLFTAAYVTAFESMRKSGASGPGKPMTGYQQMMAETRRQNLAVQRARILNQIAAEYEGTTYKQVLHKGADGGISPPPPQAGGKDIQRPGGGGHSGHQRQSGGPLSQPKPPEGPRSRPVV